MIINFYSFLDIRGLSRGKMDDSISVLVYLNTMMVYFFFSFSHLISFNFIAPHYTIAIGTITITIQRPYFPVQSDLKRSSKLNLFHRIPLCLASRDQCFRLCVSIHQISSYEVIKQRILMQWMFYLHSVV